jgi:hypothetical protein
VLCGIAASLGARAAHAQLVVDEISIVAARADQGGGPGWILLVEVVGEDLASVVVLPPLGSPLVLDDTSGSGSAFGFQAGPFDSFGELQDAYPAGDYAFAIDGSETVTLAWDPAEPVGAAGQPTLSIDTPADGSVGVSSTPDVAYTFDCTNCKDMRVDLADLATGGMAAFAFFGELDVVGGAFTNPVPFDALNTGSGPSPPFPDGPTEAVLLMGLVTFSDEAFDPPSALPTFEYVEASLLLAQSAFVVPEPSAGVSACAALAVLALLRARRN